MIRNLVILVFILAAFAATAAAQDTAARPQSGGAEAHLSACQAVHNMPRTLSRLHETRMTASQESFEQDMMQLRWQVQALDALPGGSVNAQGNFGAEIAALSQTLGNLNLRLSESPLTRPPYAKSIPENFDQTLRQMSLYWDCDKFASDLALPMITPAEGGSAVDNIRSTRPNADMESSPVPDYRHVQNRNMSANASSRYLAQNSVKLIFEDNRHYLILFGILAFIGGLYYLSRRIKKFEAREARRILNRLIKVRLEDRIHDFYLVDLSRNGAKLNHPRAIEGQNSLHIQLGDEWHQGQIKWHNDFFAGVLFKTPLDVETFSDATYAA